jgi:nitrate/nitrite transport system permease protein
MTALAPETRAEAEQSAEKPARQARIFTRITRMDGWFQVLGLAWLTPILKAAAGDNPRAQMKEVWQLLGVPLIAIAVFLIAWGTLAPKVQTSLGAIPGPVQVWEQVGTFTPIICAKKTRLPRFMNAKMPATPS